MSIRNTNKELGCVCNNDGANCSTVQQATNAKFKFKFTGHSPVTFINLQILELCTGAIPLLFKRRQFTNNSVLGQMENVRCLPSEGANLTGCQEL